VGFPRTTWVRWKTLNLEYGEEMGHERRPGTTEWFRRRQRVLSMRAYGAIADVPWLLCCPILISLDDKDSERIDVKGARSSDNSVCETQGLVILRYVE
jgi:hypothetical protein